MRFVNDSGTRLENVSRIDAPELMQFPAVTSVTTKGVTSLTGTSAVARNRNQRSEATRL